MKKLTTDTFIERAIQVHGTRFDYSKVNYTSSKTNVIIICKVHGEFEQNPTAHLTKRNTCKRCALEKLFAERRITKDEFIKRANEIHLFQYSYDNLNYTNATSKVEIICPHHGSFMQLAFAHLKGQGCKECFNSKQTHTRENFIECAVKLHGNKYDYSQVIYANIDTKVKIICKIHGEFEQSPYHHLKGNNCPQCNFKSHGEELIKVVLNNFSIPFEFEKSFPTCVHKWKLRFDFYLPTFNILIEFDGRQHSEQSFFEPLELIQLRDNIKTKWAKDNNITLLRFNNLKTLENDLLTMLQLI